MAASVKIRRLLKEPGISELDRTVYVSDLAMVDRRKGSPQEGLKVLGAELPAELQRRARPQLEKGLCLQALKRWDDAMSVLRPLTGVEENHIRLPAGLAVAQVAVELRQYQQAIDACQQVIRDGRGESLIGDLATVRSARELLEVATDAFALEVLGKDFQTYRQARLAQAAGKYAEAIDLYDRIRQNPVLLDAARCYAAEYYYLLGEDRKGERIYREFVADNLFGLYRGEARLQWARFILLRKPGATALQEARKQLEEASEWFELVVAKKPSIEVGDVQVMVKYFPAPDAYTRPGDLGGLVRSYAGPATILNRLTARWYVPMHHVHALLLLGYTCFELEDYEGATAAIEKAVSLNQAYGGASACAALRPVGVQASACAALRPVGVQASRRCAPWCSGIVEVAGASSSGLVKENPEQERPAMARLWRYLPAALQAARPDFVRYPWRCHGLYSRCPSGSPSQPRMVAATSCVHPRFARMEMPRWRQASLLARMETPRWRQASLLARMEDPFATKDGCGHLLQASLLARMENLFATKDGCGHLLRWSDPWRRCAPVSLLNSHFFRLLQELQL